MRTAVVLCALLASCHVAAAAPLSPTDPSARAPRVAVITRDGMVRTVHVELARTENERSRGLMHRRSLGADNGMLFVFDEEADHAFWMRNTLISLDIIFISSDGTVVGIVPNARPQSDTPRAVGRKSRYVLEVNGGWCAQHGVRSGDRVELGEAIESTQAARPTNAP